MPVVSPVELQVYQPILARQSLIMSVVTGYMYAKSYTAVINNTVILGKGLICRNYYGDIPPQC